MPLAYRGSRRAPRLITPRRAPNDMIDPSDAAEPIESTDANDPIEPIDSADPTEPIDSTEPREPIDSSEFSDQSDHFELPGCGSAPGSPVSVLDRRVRVRVVIAGTRLLGLSPGQVDAGTQTPDPFVVRLCSLAAADDLGRSLTL
jgi:hypothetical protein